MLSFSLFFSCEKQEFRPQESCIDDQHAFNERAKRWFDNETGGAVLFEVENQMKSTNGLNDSIALLPDWNQSMMADYEHINNMEIPVVAIENPELINNFAEVTSPLKDASVETNQISQSRFVIQTNEATGETRGFMMTIVPDEDYLNLRKDISNIDYYNRDDEFSGLILFDNLDGTFANGWKYKEGEIVYGFYESQSPENLLKSVVSITITTCYKVRTEVAEFSHSYTQCYTRTTHLFIHTAMYFEDIGGGGGGAGGASWNYGSLGGGGGYQPPAPN